MAGAAVQAAHSAPAPQGEERCACAHERKQKGEHPSHDGPRAHELLDEKRRLHKEKAQQSEAEHPGQA